MQVNLTTRLQYMHRSLLAKLEEQALAFGAANLRRSERRTIDARTEYYSLLSVIPMQTQQLVQEADKVATSERILKSLLFDEIKVRHDQIHEAHENTFNWIFDDDATSFKKWLTSSSDDVFWVSGKAGSGKSTLMKFLCNHKTTDDLLQQWAGGQKLVFANFFFWNSGLPMQKSQIGLLQTLVYQILQQCPDLIPFASAHRWEAKYSESLLMERWTRAELSLAIQSIVSSGQLNSRFCFFIDGLDEYADESHGDHHNLIQDLDHLVKTSQIKLCVSSRPWNVFVKRYGDDPQHVLRLQDLTSGDMQRYVQDKLENDERFRALAAREPQASTLATQIRDKADGVFLWVYLVVRSLLRGLGESDSTDELERRLSEIPADLNLFFTKIIQTVDGTYHKYTVRALQLVSVAVDNMSSTALWRVSQDLDDPTFALKAAIEPLTQADIDALRAKAATSINKWCRDLLELKPGIIRNERYDQVNFLHRTVKDFLLTEEVRNGIFNHASCRPSPFQALCRIYLAEAKAQHLNDDKVSTFHDKASFVCYYAKMCEQNENMTPIDTLLELERTVDEARRHSKSLYWAEFPRRPLQFMMMKDLCMYVKHMLSKEPQLKIGILNVTYDILEAIGRYDRQFTSNPSAQMIKTILEQGVSPNEAFSSGHGAAPQTPWQCFLQHTYTLEHSVDTWEIAKLMLQHGADPGARTKVFAHVGKRRLHGPRREEFLGVRACLMNNCWDEEAQSRFDTLLKEFHVHEHSPQNLQETVTNENVQDTTFVDGEAFVRRLIREETPDEGLTSESVVAKEKLSVEGVSRRRKVRAVLKNILR